MKINRKRMETPRWVRSKFAHYHWRVSECNEAIRALQYNNPSFNEREKAAMARKELYVISRRTKILERIAHKIGLEFE